LAATLHDPRYKVLIRALTDARRAAGLSQQDLAELLGRPQSYIGKLETFERRLDALELFDLLSALSLPAGRFASDMAMRLARSPRAARGKKAIED
jgi:Predicted transcriptional regulator with C-terminal CBS domains